MRILYISDSSIPSYSANGIHVMKMCQAWGEQGHAVTLLAKKTNACLDNVEDIFSFYGVTKCFEIKFFPSKPFSGSGRVYNLLLPFFSFGNFDLVYTRAIYPAFWYSLFGKPISFEIHEPFDTKSKWLANLFRFIVKREVVKKWVVISSPIKNYLIESFNIPQSEILVAHDGADEVDDSHGVFGLAPNEIHVGYVGSLLKGKGMDLIFELSKVLSNVNFHVVGGTEEQLLDWKNRTLPSQELVFHGFIEHARTVEYLKAFDILIAPYKTEVFVKEESNSNNIAKWMSPLKIFEYMAVQKPIITSDLEVIREVLKNNESAILCNPDNLQEWVNAINLLSSNPLEASKIAENAYRTFTNEFTWSKRAKNILNFIDR
ncbi:glycosyltransferase involved in cell wall biosynthesis [Roseivirga pacifica]|uniref:Glycosyltransferase involved in cell wall bisynthesis n=2 Tax=Roseivirga pacifica TaxID=1267423 RepID=A0A1I0QYX9_9BACT|nr:glycosyltransferase family 4 protein [Roseivirga pacifica]RKQ42310.1 glycosyltransferase involved in cell wall biosynthesis [Roseivirga pacifica]SEW33131.1 Glycosyltransferase involved in cell wall bisynthesis [Roseivirga pacifica]